MACYTPLKAYRESGGGVTFSSRDGFGDLPLDLPCGQCVGCLRKRARHWALRCVHEASLHAKNCFVTLTYSSAITWEGTTRWGLPEDGSLDVRHWQLFAKRLRKRLGKFRFLHVGEYGERNFRPHYHAILFGQDFSEDRVVWKRKGENVLYVSPMLEELWGHGFCSIGKVNFQTAAYVARYCLKKRTHKVLTEQYRRIDAVTGEEYYVRPQYVTMSRRPGLGAGWFERFRSDVFPADELVHDGKRYSVPRYYDKLEEIGAERRGEAAEFLALKAGRKARALARREDCTPERLRERELVEESEVSLMTRVIE